MKRLQGKNDVVEKNLAQRIDLSVVHRNHANDAINYGIRSFHARTPGYGSIVVLFGTYCAT